MSRPQSSTALRLLFLPRNDHTWARVGVTDMKTGIQPCFSNCSMTQTLTTKGGSVRWPRESKAYALSWVGTTVTFGTFYHPSPTWRSSSCIVNIIPSISKYEAHLLNASASSSSLHIFHPQLSSGYTHVPTLWNAWSWVYLTGPSRISKQNIPLIGLYPRTKYGRMEIS